MNDLAIIPEDWQAEIQAQIDAYGLDAAREMNAQWAQGNPDDPGAAALLAWAGAGSSEPYEEPASDDDPDRYNTGDPEELDGLPSPSPIVTPAPSIILLGSDDTALSSGPQLIAAPAPIVSASPVVPPSTLPPMTSAQYAASRPDLAANWDNAWNNPEHATSAIGEWIRSFGTFEAYLQNDYGSPFSSGGNGSSGGSTEDIIVLPPVTVTAPPVTTTAPVYNATPVTTLASPNDSSILGGIDKWLQTMQNVYSSVTGVQQVQQNNNTPPVTAQAAASAGVSLSPAVKYGLIGLAVVVGALALRKVAK